MRFVYYDKKSDFFCKSKLVTEKTLLQINILVVRIHATSVTAN